MLKRTKSKQNFEETETILSYVLIIQNCLLDFRGY